MKKFRKIGSVVFGTMFIISMLWLSVSYVEILAKHDYPNPQYSNYNIIVEGIGAMAEYVEGK